MNNEVMVSNYVNEMFGEIRVIVAEDNAVLFCGADIARALGYEKPRNAIQSHCRCALKRGVPHPQAPDKTIEMSFIPESDVFRLVFSSKLPEAERFTDWITKEVIPSILRTGQYQVSEDSPVCHSDRSAELANIRFERRLLVKDREIFSLERKNYELEQQLRQKSADLATLEAIIDEDPADDRDKKLTILDQPSRDLIDGGYKPHGKLTMRAIRNLYAMRIDVAGCDAKDGLINTSEIAKDYGMTARAFNQMMAEYDMQTYEPDCQYWIPNPNLFGEIDRGECYKILAYGNSGKKSCYWTATGWLMIFHELSRKGNVLPDTWQQHIEDTVLPILANRYKAVPDESKVNPRFKPTPRKTVF